MIENSLGAIFEYQDSQEELPEFINAVKKQQGNINDSKSISSTKIKGNVGQ